MHLNQIILYLKNKLLIYHYKEEGKMKKVLELQTLANETREIRDFSTSSCLIASC